MDLTQIQPSKIDPSLKGKNFLFYGGPGTRKTSVAACFPNAIFAKTEDGTKFISGVRGQPIGSWGEFLQFCRELRRDEVKAMYDTVVFDRIDTIYGYCYDYTLKELGIDEPGQKGYGAGWKKIEKNWTSAMNMIERQGYGLVFICHDKDITDKSMEYVGTKVKLENTPLSVIRGMVDFIFNVKKDVDDEGRQTVIAYSDSMESDTKHRARYFTNKFEFTYDNLEKELAIAIQKQVKMEGIELEVRNHRDEEQVRSFEEVRDNVLGMVSKFIEADSPYLPDITNIIANQLQGKKISEVKENYYSQLLVIETYLYSLE